MPATTLSVPDAQSALRAAGSRALAQALVLGIDECAQVGKPLTQVQQVALATMAIMSMDEILDAADLMTLDLPAV